MGQADLPRAGREPPSPSLSGTSNNCGERLASVLRTMQCLSVQPQGAFHNGASTKAAAGVGMEYRTLVSRARGPHLYKSTPQCVRVVSVAQQPHIRCDDVAGPTASRGDYGHTAGECLDQNHPKRLVGTS